MAAAESLAEFIACGEEDTIVFVLEELAQSQWLWADSGGVDMFVTNFDGVIKLLPELIGNPSPLVAARAMQLLTNTFLIAEGATGDNSALLRRASEAVVVCIIPLLHNLDAIILDDDDSCQSAETTIKLLEKARDNEVPVTISSSEALQAVTSIVFFVSNKEIAGSFAPDVPRSALAVLPMFCAPLGNKSSGPEIARALLPLCEMLREKKSSEEDSVRILEALSAFVEWARGPKDIRPLAEEGSIVPNVLQLLERSSGASHLCVTRLIALLVLRMPELAGSFVENGFFESLGRTFRAGGIDSRIQRTIAMADVVRAMLFETPATASEVFRAQEGNLNPVAILGRDVPVQDLLIDAVRAGNASRVKELVSFGALVNGTAGRHAQTPLKEAVTRSTPEMCALLVALKADVNARHGATPLHFAVHSGRRENVRALLALGADVSAVDDGGKTPQDLIDTCRGPRDEIRALFAGAAAFEPMTLPDVSDVVPLETAMEDPSAILKQFEDSGFLASLRRAFMTHLVPAVIEAFSKCGVGMERTQLQLLSFISRIVSFSDGSILASIDEIHSPLAEFLTSRASVRQSGVSTTKEALQTAVNIIVAVSPTTTTFLEQLVRHGFPSETLSVIDSKTTSDEVRALAKELYEKHFADASQCKPSPAMLKLQLAAESLVAGDGDVKLHLASVKEALCDGVTAREVSASGICNAMCLFLSGEGETKRKNGLLLTECLGDDGITLLLSNIHASINAGENLPVLLFTRTGGGAMETLSKPLRLKFVLKNPEGAADSAQVVEPEKDVTGHEIDVEPLSTISTIARFLETSASQIKASNAQLGGALPPDSATEEIARIRQMISSQAQRLEDKERVSAAASDLFSRLFQQAPEPAAMIEPSPAEDSAKAEAPSTLASIPTPSPASTAKFPTGNILSADQIQKAIVTDVSLKALFDRLASSSSPPLPAVIGVNVTEILQSLGSDYLPSPCASELMAKLLTSIIAFLIAPPLPISRSEVSERATLLLQDGDLLDTVLTAVEESIPIPHEDEVAAGMGDTQYGLVLAALRPIVDGPEALSVMVAISAAVDNIAADILDLAVKVDYAEKGLFGGENTAHLVGGADGWSSGAPGGLEWRTPPPAPGGVSSGFEETGTRVIAIKRPIGHQYFTPEKYFPGTVMANNEDDTFDVAYDDGDRDRALPRRDIRLMPPGFHFEQEEEEEDEDEGQGRRGYYHYSRRGDDDGEDGDEGEERSEGRARPAAGDSGVAYQGFSLFGGWNGSPPQAGSDPQAHRIGGGPGGLLRGGPAPSITREFSALTSREQWAAGIVSPPRQFEIFLDSATASQPAAASDEEKEASTTVPFTLRLLRIEPRQQQQVLKFGGEDPAAKSMPLKIEEPIVLRPESSIFKEIARASKVTGETAAAMWLSTFVVEYSRIPMPDSGVSSEKLPSETLTAGLRGVVQTDLEIPIRLLSLIADALPRDAEKCVSETLSRKLIKQLSDPLAVVCDLMPAWCYDLPCLVPQILPLPTRLKWLKMTALGTSRALNVLQGASGGGPRAAVPQLQQEVVRVDRERLLDWGELVMEKHAERKTQLQVLFRSNGREENGVGVGATREFYSLLATEFGSNENNDKIRVWRSGIETGIGMADESLSGKENSNQFGLFPAPLPDDAAAAELVLKRCRNIGIFIGKCIQQDSTPGLFLSLPLCSLLLNHPLPSNTLSLLQPSYARILSEFKGLLKEVAIRKAQGDESSLKFLSEAAENLERQSLTFVTPTGHPLNDVEANREREVTLENLSEYVTTFEEYFLKTVFDLQVRRSIQALREGINSVLSLERLSCLLPSDLQALLFTFANWSHEEIHKYVSPDVGFTEESETLHWMRERLLSMTQYERQSFLQFATGSPCLPLGGLKNLIARDGKVGLRISQRTCDGDSELVTCNTCLHKVKIPHYSSGEVLRERLEYSVSNSLSLMDFD